MAEESASAHRNELLDVDLRKSQVAPYFSAEVHSLTGVLPANSGLLQVMGISNIAQPLQKRHDNAATPRLLLLTLSDGHTKVSGIELQPISALKCSMAPGLKVLYKGGRVINGRLILTPDNIEVLGGRVKHPYESWKASELALRQRSGKSPQSKDGPPQFNLALRLDEAKATAAQKPTKLVSDLPQPLAAAQPQPQSQGGPGKRGLQAVTATVIPGEKERERSRDVDSGRDTGGGGRGRDRGGDRGSGRDNGRDSGRDRDRGWRERGRDRQALEPALQGVRSVQSIDWYVASTQSEPPPLPRPSRSDHQDHPPGRRERDLGYRGGDAEPFSAAHSPPPRPLSPPPVLNLAAEAQFPTLPTAPRPQPQPHPQPQPRQVAPHRSHATPSSLAHAIACMSLAPVPPREEKEDLGLFAYCKPNASHRQGKAKIKGEGQQGRQGEEKRAEPWSCTVCTFLNHPSLMLCEMCEAPAV